MPDRRRHRGPHPDDEKLFARAALPALRAATGDLGWLLSRGYADKSSLKLVGDRYGLSRRQRIAVMRSACSDEALRSRRQRRMGAEGLRGRPLLIDGYNVLTTVEAGLAGGVVLACRDGTFRDIASMHGTYRRVAETEPGVRKMGRVLAALGVSRCQWLFDSPVSNSGRLRGLMLEIAEGQGWPWEVELSRSPDRALIQANGPVASADSAVLDACGPWFNLAREIVTRSVPGAWVVDLSLGEDADG